MGDYLDPSGPNVILGVLLMRGEEESELEESHVMMDAEGERCCDAVQSREPRNVSSLQDLEKDSPLQPPEGASLLQHLDLAQVRPILYLRPPEL